MRKERLTIDLSKPRTHRPMVGLDIEQWRAERGMAKYDAQYALGFRNSNHYNKMCLAESLPADLELLIRIYEESPLIPGPGWPRYSIKDLFTIMYGDALSVFRGTQYETHARVDLGTRYTKIFGRSSARQYQWLDDDGTRNEADLNAYSVMERILAKLHNVDDPRSLLERVAKRVWLLRGQDLDAGYAIPTMENPPTRKKTGRKSKMSLGMKKPANRQVVSKASVTKKVVAKVKPAAKTTVKPKELTPAKALAKSVGASRRTKKKAVG